MNPIERLLEMQICYLLGGLAVGIASTYYFLRQKGWKSAAEIRNQIDVATASKNQASYNVMLQTSRGIGHLFEGRGVIRFRGGSPNQE